jgi:1-acyl-sn-glycerol-3-phosphate acyltransferase
MLYLVNEMYKQRDKTIKITFGKPIPYQIFDKRMSTLAWSQKVREHVYEVEKDRNVEFKY